MCDRTLSLLGVDANQPLTVWWKTDIGPRRK